MPENIFQLDFSKAIPCDFFKKKTGTVAQKLLGQILVRELPTGEMLSARIVETEAYLPENDLSNHAAVGRTKRNNAMWQDGGIAYVYKIYGVHYCFNIVTESENLGCAVLIRAAEPLAGIDIMKELRGTEKVGELLKGPGNFARAFGFTSEDSFKSCCTPELFIQKEKSVLLKDIFATPRIGISKAVELPLRYIIKGNAFVSGRKSLNTGF
ncbi:MAG: DNA-3-methyladenine glycosylase [Bacteroidota bacterium]